MKVNNTTNYEMNRHPNFFVTDVTDVDCGCTVDDDGPNRGNDTKRTHDEYNEIRKIAACMKRSAFQ